MRKLILAAILLLLCPLMRAQQTLNNDSIIKMVKAGLSADIVIAAVNSQPGHFDISPDGLIAMKKAGASDRIISALIAKNAGGVATAGPAQPSSTTTTGGDDLAFGGTGTPNNISPGVNGLPQGIDSTGVYFKDKSGNWTEMDAEVVNFKTSGALKHFGSAGIVKEDMNGDVAGFHSHLMLQPPADFILYLPEGVSPGEYQLIRFREGKDSREFRSLTGGVAHTSGGAARDTADFTSRKIAPHAYEIILNSDLGKGEYGFLPSQESAGGKNLTSSGKIYTFSFAE
jgi:hypothetical protein